MVLKRVFLSTDKFLPILFCIHIGSPRKEASAEAESLGTGQSFCEDAFCAPGHAVKESRVNARQAD
jgi:hypothetical protein